LDEAVFSEALQVVGRIFLRTAIERPFNKTNAIAWLAQATVDLQSHVRDFFMDAQETTGECS
jgi:hypothetical protein